MEYFGILSKNDFENELIKFDLFSDDADNSEIEEELFGSEIEKALYVKNKIQKFELRCLLVKKGIFEKDYISDNIADFEANNFQGENNLSFEDFEVDITAPRYLSIKVYDSIFWLFKNEVKNIKLTFFNKFREDIYGHNFEKRKKIALKEFKRIYRSLNITNEQNSIEIGLGKNTTTFTPSYFYKLYFHRQSIINRLHYHSYLPYLYGELELYFEWPYHDKELFKEILLFQINLEILIELNEEFKFELDVYFNQIFFYELQSIIYTDIFTRENSFVFTFYTINNFSEINSTDIESLFDFLITEKLYVGNKTEFMKIINNEFKTTFTKIRDYDTNENHQLRVKNLKNEWLNFTKKYC
jgi:hypothetical protein